MDTAERRRFLLGLAKAVLRPRLWSHGLEKRPTPKLVLRGRGRFAPLVARLNFYFGFVRVSLQT